LQGFLFGAQSFCFLALVGLSFGAQTSDSFERTLMFCRTFLLFSRLTPQFFYSLPRLLGLDAVFGFQAQALLFNEPPRSFFSPDPIFHFLQPAAMFFGVAGRSLNLGTSTREVLLHARQRFFVSLQTKQITFSTTGD
jgi:hypothetical protein